MGLSCFRVSSFYLFSTFLGSSGTSIKYVWFISHCNFEDTDYMFSVGTNIVGMCDCL